MVGAIRDKLCAWSTGSNGELDRDRHVATKVRRQPWGLEGQIQLRWSTVGNCEGSEVGDGDEGSKPPSLPLGSEARDGDRGSNVDYRLGDLEATTGAQRPATYQQRPSEIRGRRNYGGVSGIEASIVAGATIACYDGTRSLAAYPKSLIDDLPTKFEDGEKDVATAVTDVGELLSRILDWKELRLRKLEQAKETQTEVLMGQQRLRNLSLHWGGEEANESSESAIPLHVFEALRPNVHLEKLEILSYKGVEFPN
ncbi:hypothetical protein ZIOFF_021357 [Zingiber officinale]|uniref:R13L1/DRL21-like LRR repeat region domain-containing protein n=1 Tax=Zingiber officinale TaxID=94328 RepID=A0A8J5H9L9_ZINOF|nr:hypothetical protein ZIOFF_021357 [Zingiber officinale]